MRNTALLLLGAVLTVCVIASQYDQPEIDDGYRSLSELAPSTSELIDSIDDQVSVPMEHERSVNIAEPPEKVVKGIKKPVEKVKKAGASVKTTKPTKQVVERKQKPVKKGKGAETRVKNTKSPKKVVNEEKETKSNTNSTDCSEKTIEEQIVAALVDTLDDGKSKLGKKTSYKINLRLVGEIEHEGGCGCDPCSNCANPCLCVGNQSSPTPPTTYLTGTPTKLSTTHPTTPSTPSTGRSKTPSATPSRTPPTTHPTTPSATPSTKNSTTPSKTPSTTPSKTPPTTHPTTPSATPSTKNSTTPPTTRSTTPSKTPPSTPSKTPSTTPSRTPPTTHPTTSSTTPSTKNSTTPSRTPPTTHPTTSSTTPSTKNSTTPPTTRSTTPTKTPSTTPPTKTSTTPPTKTSTRPTTRTVPPTTTTPPKPQAKRCPKQFRLIDGRCYIVLVASTTEAKSEQICFDYGAKANSSWAHKDVHLGTIENDEQNSGVLKMAMQSADLQEAIQALEASGERDINTNDWHLWIGVRRKPNVPDPYSRRNDTWYYTRDKRFLHYDYFAPGEPNNRHNNEECVYMYLENGWAPPGTWNDHVCEMKNVGVLCEYLDPRLIDGSEQRRRKS